MLVAVMLVAGCSSAPARAPDELWCKPNGARFEPWCGPDDGAGAYALSCWSAAHSGGAMVFCTDATHLPAACGDGTPPRCELRDAGIPDDGAIPADH